MMFCVNCEWPVTYNDKAARKCPHCGKDPSHEQKGKEEAKERKPQEK